MFGDMGGNVSKLPLGTGLHTDLHVNDKPVVGGLEGGLVLAVGHLGSLPPHSLSRAPVASDSERQLDPQRASNRFSA
jgi:hypothetical protein